MKIRYQLIIVIATFTIGVGVCLYPFVAQYINFINNSKIVENMREQIANTPDQNLEDEKERVRNYNQSLLSNDIVLINGYSSKQVTDSNLYYENLLSLTDSMAYIEIASINVKLPIYHGTNEDVLEKGVGHLQNTSLPLGGTGTHTVLSAHTGMPNSRLFTDLDQVVEGTIFYIYVLDEKLTYMVDQIKVVEPEDTSDLIIDSSKDYTTLVTCTPYGKNTHRLLVRGIRIENETEEISESNNTENVGLNRILLKFTTRDIIVILSLITLLSIFLPMILKVKGNNSKKKKGTHFKKRQKGKHFAK